ncbi:hypothetical protein ID866_9533 [Astraeus odoratus]|nr:hypothetical protein ID866_9533 [Astraeus odoratus]
MKRERVKPDLVIYNSLLACVAEEGLPLEAWAVVDDMLAMGVPPDRQSYHHILHASRWSPLEATWETLERMSQEGVPPNEQTYALVIKRIVSTEGIELALQLMHEMADRGLTPDLTTTQEVVKLAANLHFPRLAIDIAQNFETYSIRRIDGETWLSCLISSAELLYRAMGAYKAFRDYASKPDIETFNHLLQGCINANHRELGNKLLLDMKQAGVRPNALTYERVILLCLTQATYEDAFFYLEEMKAQKFVPPLRVYEAIIRTCVTAGDSRYALALTELGQCGYTPSKDLRRHVATHKPSSQGGSP